jgi:pimeloyl-ACP methyl ester carboxylesterase
VRSVRPVAALTVAMLAALVGPALSRGFFAGNAFELTHPQPCAQAAGFTCSTLTVPLDHAGRASGTLRLRVAVRERRSPRGVLLFLTGGPGQPGVASAERVAARLGSAVDGYTLVLLDQRGTAAGALRCRDLQRELGWSDLTVPTRAAVAKCARAIGSRRRFYGTAETVEDIEALRIALHADRMAVDGVSYGTFVAERYVLAYPGRVALLVLDSVVPHVGADALETANTQATARVLRAACREQRCAGDPARDLAAVIRARRNGPALLDALVTASIVDPTLAGVPAALQAAARGRLGPLLDFVRRMHPPSNVPPEEFSQGLHASALCSDTPMPWKAEAGLRSRRVALRRAVARIASRRLWPFDRATASGNGIVQTCLHWPPGSASPTPPGRDLPPVPALLLAGDRDLSTPLAWARWQAARTPRGRLIVVSGAGHSVQMRASSDVGRRAVTALLQRRR